MKKLGINKIIDYGGKCAANGTCVLSMSIFKIIPVYIHLYLFAFDNAGCISSIS